MFNIGKNRPKTESGEATYRNTLEAAVELRTAHGQWWKTSDPKISHPHPWPAGLDPVKAPVFARNEIEIQQLPEKVFAALTDAKTWPQFFPNAKDVKLPEGKTQLEPGMKFTWQTFASTQTTEVTEYEKNKVLAWDAKSPGNEAYHRWILEPTASGGTRIITEEIQTGPTAKLDKGLMNPALHASHQLWLETMKTHLEKPPAGGWVR